LRRALQVALEVIESEKRDGHLSTQRSANGSVCPFVDGISRRRFLSGNRVIASLLPFLAMHWHAYGKPVREVEDVKGRSLSMIGACGQSYKG
jgi:hypothetical protein